MVVNLKSRKATSLAEGVISAPVASPDGRYILFNQAGRSALHTQIYTMQTGKQRTPVRFDLSGITGFMAFSRDGRYLYFNHYLNDTNMDQVIDGNDHSVAFRVPFQRWLDAKQPYFPEQLTSVSNNCKFPSLSDKYLYLTCAFEGSLDVYRLPLTGAVPPKWSAKQLWEAHLSAREYEDRLLVLNTLRYRFKVRGISMLERLLSDHLQLGELAAASYYLTQIKQYYRGNKAKKPAIFYDLLQQYLQVRSSKQRVPVGMITAKFQNLVEQQRQKLRAGQAWPQLLTLIDAYLDYELDQNSKALAKLKSIPEDGPMFPLQRFIMFDLYHKLYAGKTGKLLPHYQALINASNLSREVKLYYGFHYLKSLQLYQTDVSRRIKTIESRAAAITDSGVAQLFAVEVLAIKLAGGNKLTSDPAQRKHFTALTALLNKNRANPLVRKAMHTRAIQILGEAEQFQFMELLSRNWLVTTQISEMEFVNVAEQYAVITMDKAYGMLAAKQLANAYGTFYSAIQQTNDLEAHYQFVTMGGKAELHQRIDQQRAYQSLIKRGILGQNKNYVDALRLLIKATATEKTDLKALDKALLLLDAMQVKGLNPSMRDLMIGYIYHLKMRAGRHHYIYDKNFFQKAHHHYMLALDLGKDNSRISASVWENLAWLHYEARNYGLSADFFQQRINMPFTGAADEIRLRWWFARSLFFNNAPTDAWQQAQTVLRLARENRLPEQPYLEKTAFYAMQAGKFEHASANYAAFLKDAGNAVNHAKAVLAYGFTLLHLGKKDLAREQFQQVLNLSKNLPVQAADSDRLVAFQPRRLTWLALGFLAELAEQPSQQAHFRQQRVAQWRQIKSHITDYASDEASRLSAMVKDLNLIAAAHEKAGDLNAMTAAMDEALIQASAWADLRSDPTGPVIYRSLVNYLSLGISHPQSLSGKERNRRTQKRVRAALDAFKATKFRSDAGSFQFATLELLWQTYRNRVMGEPAMAAAGQLKTIMHRAHLERLRKNRKDLVDELNNLAQSLTPMLK